MNCTTKFTDNKYFFTFSDRVEIIADLEQKEISVYKDRIPIRVLDLDIDINDFFKLLNETAKDTEKLETFKE